MSAVTPEMVDELVRCLKGYAASAGTEGFAINAACLALETFTQSYKDALAEARNAALEEAAKVADDWTYDPQTGDNIAQAIRDMKDRT